LSKAGWYTTTINKAIAEAVSNKNKHRYTCNYWEHK